MLLKDICSKAKLRKTSDEIVLMKNEISHFKNELYMFKSEVKKHIKEDYSKINLSLDKIFRQLINSQSLPHQEIAALNLKQDLLSNVKFPLESCEEVSLLEEQIRNEEFRTQLIDFLSKIGGRTGVEDAMKIAYKVIDCVFKREVLMQYSWTGVSRGSSIDKKPFQILDGILGVFFEVISLADNRYTRKKNCTIFKDGVLKHAKKRAARKRPRLANVLPDNIVTDVTDEEVFANETNDTDVDVEVNKIDNDKE